MVWEIPLSRTNTLLRSNLGCHSPNGLSKSVYLIEQIAEKLTLQRNTSAISLPLFQSHIDGKTLFEVHVF